MLTTPRRLLSTQRQRRAAGLALAFTTFSAALTTGLSTAQAQERVVTPQQRSMAQQVATAGVPLAELAPNAPDSYSVKGGDTLWDIAKVFLKSPWRWPELWGMNLEQIQNPHLIYPGQMLMLLKNQGRARLAVADAVGGTPADTVRLSPSIRGGDAKDAITTVSMSVIAPFLQEMGVFSEGELARSPRIVAASDERVLIGRGDRAYAVGSMGNVRDWSVFRSAAPLKDPRTQEVLGYEARLVGAAQYVRAGEVRQVAGREEVVPASMTITQARSEIRAGDRLLPQVSMDLANVVPRAASKPIQGQVVSVYGDGLIAGQNQIVSINRGARDGVDRGHVFSVLRDGNVITDRTGADGKPQVLKLPDEQHGTLFVFRVFDRVSYALLLQARVPVRAGDHFDMP